MLGHGPGKLVVAEVFLGRSLWATYGRFSRLEDPFPPRSLLELEDGRLEVLLGAEVWGGARRLAAVASLFAGAM